MTLSNAEAISHMAYGMPYRIYYAAAEPPRCRPSVSTAGARVAPRCIYTMHRGDCDEER